MTNNQLFFSLMMITLCGALAGALKLYLDAKLDPIKRQVDLLVKYMIIHEGKIATLEERTKNLLLSDRPRRHSGQIADQEIQQVDHYRHDDHYPVDSGDSALSGPAPPPRTAGR